MRTLRTRALLLLAGLLLANCAAWALALLVFGRMPVLLGSAALAWGLGLRHAMDADHIAAIDNVTRRMVQDGRRPVATGFFFAVGHSAVVMLAVLTLVLEQGVVKDHLPLLQDWGARFGTVISVGFLLVIALVNLGGLLAILRGADRPVGGLLARLLRPALRLVTRSWQMLPLGFLFGLGFDTATEIGLLGMAASEAVKGLSSAAVLVFPVLFTAAMSLVDSADGAVMAGAYSWAFEDPGRKRSYNLVVTAASVLAALVVGGIEAADALGIARGGVVEALAANMPLLGCIVVAICLASWAVSLLLHRRRSQATP